MSKSMKPSWGGNQKDAGHQQAAMRRLLSLVVLVVYLEADSDHSGIDY